MSLIDMTALSFSDMVPMPYTLGNVQEAPAGLYRVDRMGDRWSFQCQTPTMPIEPEGRRWQALFDDAERSGGLFRIKQPGLAIGAPGSPTIATTVSAGKLLALTGLTPRYTIRQGQWLSFVIDGVNYCDRIMDAVQASASGTAGVRIKNLLRVTLPAGTAINLAEPRVGGTIAMQSPVGWPVSRQTSFAFTVTEDQ